MTKSPVSRRVALVGAGPMPLLARRAPITPETEARHRVLVDPAPITIAGSVDLVFVTWKWKQNGFREVYTAQHVNTMHAMLKRHTKMPFRHICITDDATGIDAGIQVHPLWNDHNDMANVCGRHLPSCYRRLKLFSPIEQAKMGIAPGARIVSIDIDGVITGPTDELWKRPERFVGWARRGSRHPTVFNGSLFMFTAGDLENIWTEFEPRSSPTIANRAGYMGSDQSWLSYMLIRQNYIGGFGPRVQAYPDFKRQPLKPNASIVFFNGREKPWHPATITQAPWIADHWRKDDAHNNG